MSNVKKLSFVGTLARVMGFSLIGAVAAFAVVAVVMLIRPETGKFEVMSLAGLAAGVLIMGAGMAYSIRWWRGVDEAVRQAHSWAWYWGGSTGMLFVGTYYIMSVFTDGEVSRRLVEMLGAAGREVELGVGIAMVPLLIGYGAGWVVWWLRHR